MQPYVIKSVEKDGEEIFRRKPQALAQPIKKNTAARLARMMESTVHNRRGTAYRGFYKNGRYLAAPLKVAGKTGSLNGKTPHEQFTWMIGFAKWKQNDAFAFACLVMNDENWTIKAASFSGQFFKHYARLIKYK